MPLSQSGLQKSPPRAGKGRSILLRRLSGSFYYCYYESSTERNRDSGNVLIKRYFISVINCLINPGKGSAMVISCSSHLIALIIKAFLWQRDKTLLSRVWVRRGGVFWKGKGASEARGSSVQVARGHAAEVGDLGGCTRPRRALAVAGDSRGRVLCVRPAPATTVESRNVHTLESRVISGGSAQISIIYRRLNLRTESLTTCFDSKPSPVWFGEYRCTFIHTSVSQMIRFRQRQRLYKLLPKRDLCASTTIYQLRRSFITDATGK